MRNLFNLFVAMICAAVFAEQRAEQLHLPDYVPLPIPIIPTPTDTVAPPPPLPPDPDPLIPINLNLPRFDYPTPSCPVPEIDLDKLIQCIDDFEPKSFCIINPGFLEDLQQKLDRIIPDFPSSRAASIDPKTEETRRVISSIPLSQMCVPIQPEHGESAPETIAPDVESCARIQEIPGLL